MRKAIRAFLAVALLAGIAAAVNNDQLKATTVPTLAIYGGQDRPEGQHATAAEQIPSDSPAARQFSAWLKAYNSGNRDVLLKFLQDNYPSEAPNVDMEIQRRLVMTGGYDFKKTEASSSDKYSAILKMQELEQYVRATIQVEPDEPHRISHLDFQNIPRPAEFPSLRMTQEDAISALRTKLATEAAADRFSGAVIVAKGGRPIFSGAYGPADREKKVPNTLNTKFRLGSMNKIFTAVGVLQLAQAGKINLDDPIGKYITDYPNKEVSSKVRIKNLLTHTGGTGDIWGPEYDTHRNQLRTLQDYVNLYGTRNLEFEPGSQVAYSNYGFLLLGVLIERVSGVSYYDYVRDNIYKPAGMASTGSEPEDVFVPNRSIAYTRLGEGDVWHENNDSLPYRGTSAGGGYSSVEDLLRFANALTQHKLLDAHYLDLLINGDSVVVDGQKRRYGAGGRTWDGVKYFGHNGGFPGMNGDLEISLESGYVIAVLANMDAPAAQRISEFIGSRLPEK